MSTARTTNTTSFFSVSPDTYTGFVGLNTTAPGFRNYIMQARDIRGLFADGKRYVARFVYPCAVADGFNQPVIFSSNESDDNGIKLNAEITTNRAPASWLTWFASKAILPQSYTMTDSIQFAVPREGFGSGTVRISSVDCVGDSGKQASIAAYCLSVANRPGLFFKVKNREGNYHRDVAIFFPDKADGMMHRPVQYGEAFVLLQEGIAPDADLICDINATFNQLVKRSYGENQGLYCVETHRPIETCFRVFDV